MDLFETLNRFYYDQVLNELRMMNETMLYPRVNYHSVLYLELIHDWGKCTASDLARALHVSKPAVTSKINELIRQGLVEKIQSEEDRRVYYLKVRPEIVEEYRVFDQKTFHAAQKIQQRFSTEEIETFCAVMDAFCYYYQEDTNDEPGPGTQL